MKQACGKAIPGLIMAMVFVLLGSAGARAGIAIEEYSPKLNGVQGVITRIEGNRITLRDGKGKLVAIKIRGESADDKNKIRLFRIGDRMIIDDGKLALPQR